jgi:hypothetical protein
VWQTLGSLATQGGPWGLVAFGVLSILRGWLIPRRTHMDRVADLKAAISALEVTVREREKQIGILLGQGAREPTP